MGWLGINKDITSWELYKDGKTFRVFMHLLLTCNYSSTQWDDICIDRGELVTSLSHLCDDLGMSKHTLLNALSVLEDAGEIIKKSDQKRTYIRIVNYDYWTHMFVDSDYQKSDGAKNAQDAEPSVQKLHHSSAKNAPVQCKNYTTVVQKLHRSGAKIAHNITNKTNKTKKEQNNTLIKPCESEMSDFLKSKGFEGISRDVYDACDAFGFEKIGNWRAFCLKVARTKMNEPVKQAPIDKPKPKPKATVTQKEKDEFLHLMEGLGN